jgi:hypothetical protein
MTAVPFGGIVLAVDPAHAGRGEKPTGATWSERSWHVHVLGRTDFPVDAGLAVDAETPFRLRFGLGLGLVPGPYVEAINAVGVTAGWYDEAMGDLIRDTIRTSMTIHPVIGVRPHPRKGFLIDAGLKLAVLGGRDTTAGLLSGLTGQEVPELFVDEEARALRTTDVLGLATVKLGWVWEPVDQLAVRFDIGGAFTVFSESTISPPDSARRPEAWGLLLDAGEDYLDQTMTTYVMTPTLSISLGWRAL